jgi:aspartate aminotransferase
MKHIGGKSFMKISRLANAINESPTLKLSEEARLLKAKGEPVIHLGIGEPKNTAPPQAISFSNEKLKSGMIKYGPTDGLPSLKNAIIQYTEENYRRNVGPENIIVTNGAKQSLFNILYSVVEPEDEVILLAPYWVSYPEIVKIVGGNPVVVFPEDGTFIPSMEAIEAAVNTNTKAILMNSPNNPSGAVYPQSLISALVGLCEQKDIYLIADDIYHQLVFDGNEAPSVFGFTDKEVDNSSITIVNGISKLYGMTGFRIGWTVASRKLVEVMTKIQSQMTSCPSIISQVAAEGALMGDQSVVEDLRRTIQNNRNVLLEKMNDFTDVSLNKPSGTFYALPDFRAYNHNSRELAEFILRKALVVTIPGSDFGMEGHLRISYAGDEQDVAEGVERIRWALDPTYSDEIFLGGQKITRDWI